MNVPKGVFRQYDVRGIVDRELTPEFARALGRAFASAAWDHCGHAPVLAVGRDNRPSGAALAAGVPAGHRRRRRHGGGRRACSPRPRSTSPLQDLKVDGGCQVTGSHNPPEFNGFKMVLAGDSMHGDHILALWEAIVTERWRSGGGRETADGSVLRALSRRHRGAAPARSGR